MKAVDRFNPTRGTFITHAWIWIRQSISRALENNAQGLRILAEWVRPELRSEKQDSRFENSQSESREHQSFHAPRLFYSLGSRKDDSSELEISSYAID